LFFFKKDVVDACLFFSQRLFLYGENRIMHRITQSFDASHFVTALSY